MKELMAFKPSQTPKRPAPGGGTVERQEEERAMEEDPDDSYEARAKKRKLAQKKAQAVCLNFAGPFNFACFVIRSPLEPRRKNGLRCWSRRRGRPNSSKSGRRRRGRRRGSASRRGIG